MTVPGALLNLIQHAEKAAEVLVENMAVYLDSFNEDTKEYELTIFPLDKEEYLCTYMNLEDDESKIVYQAWFVSGLASEGKLPDELVAAIIDYVYNRQVIPDVDHRVERGVLREYPGKKEKTDEP